ncbi:hypothetical protein C8F01DRAFT_1378755 [Mycena amicta]|nr:hypothetical protein C8F01DRAFT_1378755 [Mycena amicta]
MTSSSSLRPSFLPVFANADSVSTLVSDTHNSLVIGGPTLYLSPSEAWPLCATCASPLVPLIQLNVSSPNTPAAFREFIPSVALSNLEMMTLVQLLVCPQPECYLDSIGYSTDTRSWLLRLVTVPKDSATPRSHSSDSEIIAKIENDTGFLPARVVETWTEGKMESVDYIWGPETPDQEEHRLQPGLKLLGFPEHGKFYCSEDECPGGDSNAHSGIEYPYTTCLIQLGDRHSEWAEDEALGLMAALGNTWIEQCKLHTDELTLTMSGDW